MSNSEANQVFFATLEYAKRDWAVLTLELHEVIGAVLARTGISLPYEPV